MLSVSIDSKFVINIISHDKRVYIFSLQVGQKFSKLWVSFQSKNSLVLGFSVITVSLILESLSNKNDISL